MVLVHLSNTSVGQCLEYNYRNERRRRLSSPLASLVTVGTGMDRWDCYHKYVLPGPPRPVADATACNLSDGVPATDVL